LLGEVTAARTGSTILATGDTTPARVLAFGATAHVIDPPASVRALCAAVGESVAATRHALASEVDRVGASIVVLPQAWPLGVLGTHGAFGTELSELEPVQALARELRCYLATAVSVRTARGARREALVYGPDGALVLRRGVVVPSPAGYERGDTDVAAPVGSIVDTPFGRLGVIVGREIVSVEAVRLQAFAGAELLLHPSVEYDAWALDPLRAIARARSSENALWIATAHPGSLQGRVPDGASLGATAVHDDGGVCIAELPSGRVAGVTARFDAQALRGRRSTGATNRLLQLRSGVYGPAYRSATNGSTRSMASSATASTSLSD
jgi:predicted amidohydrolase